MWITPKKETFFLLRPVLEKWLYKLVLKNKNKLVKK